MQIVIIKWTLTKCSRNSTSFAYLPKNATKKELHRQPWTRKGMFSSVAACVYVYFFSSDLASVPVHMFSMHRRDSAWLRQTVWCICFGFIALEPMRCGLKKMLDIITRTNSKNKMAQRLLFLWLLILLKLLAFIYRISVVYCKSQ